MLVVHFHSQGQGHASQLGLDLGHVAVDEVLQPLQLATHQKVIGNPRLAAALHEVDGLAVIRIQWITSHRQFCHFAAENQRVAAGDKHGEGTVVGSDGVDLHFFAKLGNQLVTLVQQVVGHCPRSHHPGDLVIQRRDLFGHLVD